MATPASSATAYANFLDISYRYDPRTIGELASDTGVKLLPAQLANSDRLSKALLSASGMVEAACTVGKKYNIDLASGINDLAALTGASEEFLKDIVCDLAMGRLFLARPDRAGEVPKAYEMALAHLEELRLGSLVFGLSAQQAASNLDTHVETAAQVEDRGGIVYTASRLFGTRNNRLHG